MHFACLRRPLLALVLVIIVILGGATSSAWAKHKHAKTPSRPSKERAGTELLDAFDREICGRRLARKPPGWKPYSNSQEQLIDFLRIQDKRKANEEQEADYDEREDDQREGRLSRNATNRVSAGYISYLGEFPWHVDLMPKMIDGDIRPTVCGGVIINRNLILTAAHCIKEVAGVKQFLVVAGFTQRQFTLDHVQVAYASKTLISSKYNMNRNRTAAVANSSTYDIGLIKLESKLRYNKWVQPACLPDKGSKLREQSGCMFAGKGFSELTNTSAVISIIDLLAMPVKLCPNGIDRKLTQTLDEICFITADESNFPGRTCQGDSGSAAMCPEDPKLGDEGRFYAVGLSSNGPATPNGCKRGIIEEALFADVEKLHDELLDMTRKILGRRIRNSPAL